MTRQKRLSLYRPYIFQPCFMDLTWKQHYTAVKGQVVRIIKLPGCPQPGTMGQYHIEDWETGEFLGMVSGSSLLSEGEIIEGGIK